MKHLTNKCILCEGSGIYYKPNGDADFDAEYCICAEGEATEKASAMKVLKVDFDSKEVAVKMNLV